MGPVSSRPERDRGKEERGVQIGGERGSGWQVEWDRPVPLATALLL
jgi:hypothetical protein